MVDIEVTGRIHTFINNYRHTYMVVGVSMISGKRATALVSKSQFDRFDYAPIEERVISQKTSYEKREDRIRSMNPLKKRKNPIQKKYKKANNPEIEKWLAEHYDIDISKLDGLDGGILLQNPSDDAIFDDGEK